VGKKRKAAGRRGTARRGTDVVYTRGEATLVGVERADELPHEQVVTEREQRQRHRVQNKALLGLELLLGEVLILGVAAMLGVAFRWFEWSFAIQVLMITVPPSFTAWLLVLGWAFRRGGR
jgi:hypothetical protein